MFSSQVETEQIGQESKVWSALAFQITRYCANIYKNLPLPLHACVQESALVCVERLRGEKLTMRADAQRLKGKKRPGRQRLRWDDWL